MKALVYTGVEELTYRDEEDPKEVSEKVFLKFTLQEFADLICMLTMVKTKEESHP